MEEQEREQRLTDFEGLVDRLILAGDLPEGLIPEQKIDLLARLVEQWRIERFKLENTIGMEDALNMEWMIHEDRVFVRRPEVQYSFGTGTPPLHLQRRLIEQLLIDHGQRRSVLGLIDDFIERIHTELHPVDFKRTSTGVIRCYTNTRFAAKKLREAGLLKYTYKEAYKIWLLTLPGFIVAAKSIKGVLPPIDRCDKQGGLGLDTFIHECQESVEDYHQFVETLASLCAPDKDIFSSFKPTLSRCHAHLRRYWATLNDQTLKASDARRISMEFIHMVDQTEGYGEFIEEFSASIQLERLIKEVQRTN